MHDAIPCTSNRSQRSVKAVEPLAAAADRGTELLADDDAGMVNDGLFFEHAPAFAEFLARREAIKERAHSRGPL